MLDCGLRLTSVSAPEHCHSFPFQSTGRCIPQQKQPSLQLGPPAGMSKRLRSQLEQEIPEDICCEIHLEPPQLFCHDDQIMLCDKYFKSQEHKNQVVYGVQEAAENYRKLFQEILNTLKEKLEVAKSILADEQERMVMMQEEEQNFKVMIESEYRIRFLLMIEENKVNFQSLQGCRFNLNLREANQNQLMEFATKLKEKFQEILQRLNCLWREKMNKVKESEVSLSEQICRLQKSLQS
nr:probable E3 ubiquitin-protein ligase TRIML2 [Kogia breviceps]